MVPTLKDKDAGGVRAYPAQENIWVKENVIEEWETLHNEAFHDCIPHQTL
jgi:hypothetical protein